MAGFEKHGRQLWTRFGRLTCPKTTAVVNKDIAALDFNSLLDFSVIPLKNILQLAYLPRPVMLRRVNT